MDNSNIRVGLLAYGAIGHEHNQAIKAVENLRLAAVCDTNPERIKAALEISPDAKSFTDANEMLTSGEIDLVIVSTPPNSHYQWAKAALEKGIHVVLEKPMALNTVQCDELLALAKEKNLLLVVYQNRRFDADFVTMQDLINSGAIGELFNYECFVGGYSKPCSYWHSDAEVSGGAIFDWGSHFIDQVLALIPEAVQHVSGINHNRVWDHVTNADHAQVTITFTGGKQALFVNSDLAAARKPKFYALGTKGAIVGDWDLSAAPNVADVPAIITLFKEDGTSEVISLKKVEPFAFHKSIGEFLKNKTPMSINPQQSRDVVAIMQLAEDSALAQGNLVKPALLLR